MKLSGVKNQRASVRFSEASEWENIEHSEPSLAFCTFARVPTRIFLIICYSLYPA